MAARILPPLIPTSASQKVRLADFATGRSELQPEHRTWLEQTVHHLTPYDQFWVDIVGFASKLGPAGGGNDPEASSAFNRQLSYDRANSVARYMEKCSNRVTSRIREFSAHGSDDYRAPPSDNSSAERAVEVHIYMVPAPPPPPPNVDPLPPLPGGRRYGSWAIAAPASVTESVIPGAVVAANVIVFRCHERNDETRAYLSPAGGLGYSLAPSGGKIVTIIKAILGRLTYSGMSFTDVTAITPFNFRDLEGATCMVGSGGGGAIYGTQACYVSVYGKVWYRQENGGAFNATRDFVKNADCSGKDLTFGVGGSAVGGPLISVS
jgi:hypothetical protein